MGRISWSCPLALLVALAPATPAAAQGAGEADAALAACVRAAEAGDRKETREAAARAEALFRAQLEAGAAEAAPRVGLARVISQCRIPVAGFMDAGRLVGESNTLLKEALRIDPSDWTARYVLALNYYHSPSFLGRTDDAIREFERLLSQTGTRASPPSLASVLLYLGDLYLREDRRAEAIGLWQRGLELFPDHPALTERLVRHRARGEG